MCIVVDPPALIPTFKTSDPKHPLFLPLKNWLDTPHGKLIYGGALYRTELSKLGSIFGVLAELQRKGKIVIIPDQLVDAEVEKVKGIEPRADFDDPHLVAIVRTSGCKLICLIDPRAHRYLRDSKFYESSKDRPKLYTRPKNASLFCKENIGRCCK